MQVARARAVAGGVQEEDGEALSAPDQQMQEPCIPDQCPAPDAALTLAVTVSVPAVLVLTQSQAVVAEAIVDDSSGAQTAARAVGANALVERLQRF